MSEIERTYSDQVIEQPQTIDVGAIDAGLRAYMLRVYNYMAMGVAVTACIVLAAMSVPEVTQLAYSARLPIFGAIVVMSFCSPWLVAKRSPAFAHACYWTYCALWGLGAVPLVHFVVSSGHENLVFFAFSLAATMFLLASLVGYTTRLNLGSIAGILGLGVMGVLIAIVVNYFWFDNNEFSLIISIGSALLFTVATAWETQSIKESYIADRVAAEGESTAVFGAYLIYGSFMAMFLNILRIVWYIYSET
jgi:uncharacterized protein